ncbi:unnamed protein product [Linum tenue]|uniref:Uncharacterized protein n=1 Tax=Linum tenue TaxID=586396 RepID=A0AAV0KWA3_9ROSI|nr:unnamed protein product [Linum tenue]
MGFQLRNHNRDVTARSSSPHWKPVVTGRLPASLFAGKKYEVVWLVKFRVDAFGWHSVSVKFKVRQSNEGEEKVRSVVVEPYLQKHKVWHEIFGGEFTVQAAGGVVEFGMYEIETKWWKGCMVLAGVKIRPKP